MEFKIVTEDVKGQKVRYLVLRLNVTDVYIGYIDRYDRLHIKSK